MTRTTRTLIRELLEQHEPEITRAFIEAVEDIISRVRITELERLIRNGQIDAALDLLDASPIAFDHVAEAVSAAYIEAGRGTGGLISTGRGAPALRALFRFDVRNLIAEGWLRTMSSRLVREISDSTRDGIRSYLEAGLARGDNPRRTALDLVGRISRTTNRRSGGIVGLTRQQQGWVDTARAQLLSGDVKQLKAYLQRDLRDKRFDPTVMRALQHETTLPRDKVDQIIGRYADRVLKHRGDMISRTETLQALNAGQFESVRQAINTGAVDPEAVSKTWRSSRDLRVRASHQGLHGKRLKIFELFRSVLGSRMQHPGDTSNGAQAADIVQCRCVLEIRIDFARGVQ